jgi:hypothetical protein
LSVYHQSMEEGLISITYVMCYFRLRRNTPKTTARRQQVVNKCAVVWSVIWLVIWLTLAACQLLIWRQSWMVPWRRNCDFLEGAILNELH